MVRTSTLALCLAAACGAGPHRAMPRHGGPFGPPQLFAVDPAWAPPLRADVGAALDVARARGLPIRVVRWGAPDAVEVRPFRSPNCGAAAGDYDAVPGTIRVDPACAPPPDLLRAAVLHEVAHALGAYHVCRYHGEPTRDDALNRCAPGLYGRAVLNPQLYYDDALAPVTDYTALDLAELRRVGALP